MSSNADVQAWERRWAGLVGRVAPSAEAARQRATLGQHNVPRAREFPRLGDADQALISAETAVVNAADAVPQRDGFRVRGQTRLHEARHDCPCLPEAFRRNRELIAARGGYGTSPNTRPSGACQRKMQSG